MNGVLLVKHVLANPGESGHFQEHCQGETSPGTVLFPLLKSGLGSGRAVNAVTFLPFAALYLQLTITSAMIDARTFHRSPGRTAPFLPGRHDCLCPSPIKLKTAADSGWSSEGELPSCLLSVTSPGGRRGRMKMRRGTGREGVLLRQQGY